jgi:putative Ig domain-containing protein
MSPNTTRHRSVYGSVGPSRAVALAGVIVLCLVLWGCAGVSAAKPFTTTPPNPTVSLSPVSVSLHSGDQQQFAATVTSTSNTAVTWSAAQGTITNSGLFTAPAVSATTAVSVTAMSVADAGVQAVVSVTVMPSSVVTVATQSLGNATEGVAYSQTLAASGGTAPYTWNTLSGTMPAGILLNSSTGIIAGTTGQSGQYNFSLQVTDSSAPQQTANASLGIAVQPIAERRITSQFFSMHINRRGTGYTGPTIPFGGYRTIDSYGTLWQLMETTNGVYDFTKLDTRLADAQAAGVDVLYTIYTTPAIHSSAPTDATCSQGPGACDPPSDVNADGTGTDASLIAFLTALVNHVGVQIQYYEVWNEANISSEWNGTWPQLVRMAQDARTTILAVNPNAKLLSPSFAEFTYASAAAKEAAYLATSVNGSTGSQAADIINFHGYTMTPALPVPIPEYEVVNLNNLRADLSSTDLAKPLWDTEWGPSTGLGDPDMDSAYIARHMLIDAGSNITRTYYYDWDPNMERALWTTTAGFAANCLSAGTPNSGGYLCETGMAYQQVETWLLGNTMTTPCAGPMPPATGVWMCGLLMPQGTQALAVWDTSKTCAAGNCTASIYGYDARYTHYFTLANDVSDQLSGGTVSIGAKPILLSQ